MKIIYRMDLKVDERGRTTLPKSIMRELSINQKETVLLSLVEEKNKRFIKLERKEIKQNEEN